MSKAEEQALKAYPRTDDAWGDEWQKRVGFVEGYEQAEQDLMEKFKMWVAHNGYTSKDVEAVYNDFEQFITDNR